MNRFHVLFAATALSVGTPADALCGNVETTCVKRNPLIVCDHRVKPVVNGVFLKSLDAKYG